MWWLMLFACPRRGELDAAAEVEALLKNSDQAWENRGSDGFDPVVSALDAAFARQPREPGVLWRLARLRVGQAFAAEDRREALSAFADARGHAIACLSVEPAMLQRDLATFSEAVTGLPPAEQPCLSWAALAWAQWSIALGPEATRLDVPRIEALNEAAGDADGRTDWTRALLASVSDPPDYGAAGKYFVAAVSADPTDLSRRADLIAYYALPANEREVAAQQLLFLDDKRAVTPEDRAAVQRGKRLR